MPPLRVGIVGLGRIGRLHAGHLARAIEGAGLAGAAVDAAHRAQLERDGTAPCRLYDDAEALIWDTGVDAVLVAAPTNLHEVHVSIAAAAGKPVFSEKPVADSVDATLRVAQAVRESGIPYQVGFQRRFDPGYARARELIVDGSSGIPEMFRGLTADRLPPVEYLRTSGGLFWDLAIHDIDAAGFLMGDEIVAVNAAGGF